MLRLGETVPAFQALKHFFMPPTETDGIKLNKKRSGGAHNILTYKSLLSKDINRLTEDDREQYLGIRKLTVLQDVAKIRQVATWRKRNPRSTEIDPWELAVQKIVIAAETEWRQLEERRRISTMNKRQRERDNQRNRSRPIDEYMSSSDSDPDPDPNLDIFATDTSDED